MTFILLFLFCFFTVKSQTNIDVTYEYTFTPDSENKANKIKTENFILTIDSDQNSVYRSIRKYKFDSAMVDLEKQGFHEAFVKLSSMPQPSTDRKVFVFKNQQGFQITNTIYGSTYLYHKNKPKNNWVIGKETKILNGYKVTNAFLDYAGRHYEAWFTQDLPINAGPYLFCGLPGLILEVYDVEKDFYFKMIEIKKSVLIFDEIENGVRKVSIQEFSKIAKNYKENPIFEMVANGAVIDEANRKKIMDKAKLRNSVKANLMELSPEY
ncbi:MULTISPECIES: GLPGLI family protein [Amniculibacterium]|uniref:GLPGLI family protein n=1 Tax=Amniculibacterium TaxID=2715289 RepID=UPI0013DE6A7B|nr:MULTISPECIES: GLPGLI family protein [Amniculibacterium]